MKINEIEFHNHGKIIYQNYYRLSTGEWGYSKALISFTHEMQSLEFTKNNTLVLINLLQNFCMFRTLNLEICILSPSLSLSLSLSISVYIDLCIYLSICVSIICRVGDRDRGPRESSKLESREMPGAWSSSPAVPQGYGACRRLLATESFII